MEKEIETLERVIRDLVWLGKRLRKIDKSQKREFILRHREMGDTFEEIGRKLGMSRQAVEQFIHHKRN